MLEALLMGIGIWMGIWVVAAILSRGVVFKNLAAFSLVMFVASVMACYVSLRPVLNFFYD